MTPGQRIRKLRLQNNLGQKELADELGYKAYTTISKWESDKSLPPGKELKKLAQYFKVSVDYILALDNLTTTNEIRPLSSAIGLAFFESIDQALLARSSDDNNQQIIEVPQLTLQERIDHYFVLEVKTDSVNQLIPTSYNIIILDFSVAKDKSLDTGDIIIVKLENDYKIVTLRKTDLMMYLEPSSFIEGFEVITLTTEKFEELDFVGKIIAAYKIFD